MFQTIRIHNQNLRLSMIPFETKLIGLMDDLGMLELRISCSYLLLECDGCYYQILLKQFIRGTTSS